MVYAGEWNGHTNRGQDPEKGGVHIVDMSSGKPREVGFVHCPGHDNDVALIKPGIIALGYTTNTCGNPPGPGFTMIDVRNPKRPKLLGTAVVAASHTITPFPGKPYVYVNGGGLATAGGAETIVDVSNPRKPKVVNEFRPNPMGCHDVSFHVSGERDLGFCAGEGEVQIWDVSDPVNPVTIAHIVNPLIQYGHYALASPDGQILAVDDEAFVAHDCVTGQSPTGAIWTYDISNPELPLLMGRFSPPRGDPGIGNEVDALPGGWMDGWCTSHHFNFIPGTRYLVTSWYTGGTNVLDLTDPRLPAEVAYYMPDDAIAWTSHWYDGRVYVNDVNRGLEVLEIDGLKEGR